MRTSTIKATIERRILVNYRVDPDALARVLPKPGPFRPRDRHAGQRRPDGRPRHLLVRPAGTRGLGAGVIPYRAEDPDVL